MNSQFSYSIPHYGHCFVIKPSLYGYPYGLSSEYIHQIVLASRHKNFSLFPISKWPSYVHVAILQANALNLDTALTKDHIRHIAWAELYQKKSQALESRF